MISRPFAVASLLMVAAAILSEPSAAAALPVGEPDPPAADRSVVGLDFEALLDSYATVSHQADGTTTTTPASVQLRALLQQEYDAGNI